MFWKPKPEPTPAFKPVVSIEPKAVIPEPLIMGRDHFAEHTPSDEQPWAIYSLKAVVADSEHVVRFWCNSEADARTLIHALDRIGGAEAEQTA